MAIEIVEVLGTRNC